MSIKLSNRVQAVKPSPTLAITARAAQMRAAGKDIIGLGAGEPDFDTPDHIKAAAVKAMDNGFTKYTAVDGTASLKKAIIDKYKKDNGLDYTPKQVLVSCGGKQSSFNLTQALLNSGDEVIIPAPFWVSYPDMVLLADGVPVIIETTQAQRFKISPEQLRAAITDKTRLIFINSPSNPSGITYSLEELKALGDVLKDYPNIIIATDDMYEHILWQQGTFVNILNAHPDLYDRTVVMNGVSKAYSMTGWRIGYAAGPADLIEAMCTIQSQSTSNPTSISQYAAEAALTGDQSFIDRMCVEFKQRHDYVVNELNSIAGVECIETDGTFYVFPNVEKLIAQLDGINDDLDFSEYLIEKAGVALVPGSAFGSPGHIRISIATSMDNLQKAMARIKAAI
ncbi:pyridoxal phosphate-dependent aminotransferase [Crenothrix polyspora]|uniref:Aminotransferase n=1 Tax=Crenothrix polyspora TaxID=360316 RepID=A0A1R4H145_9GAMM|nr:pyridoxal phosphate-dependent aminotransferase [Crenothrix polyspora]SJM89948.1 Aspartate aminotransferase [Crenothrix polyspora]